ncbi:hydrogenase maturation nickel metallochaperone HypA/HybF [Desulfolithobacter sp.]
MHEFSLAQGLMRQLNELAAAHGAKQIRKVRVSIGSSAGIVVDSFVFGFDALKADLELTRDAILEITRSEGMDLILTQVEME